MSVPWGTQRGTAFPLRRFPGNGVFRRRARPRSRGPDFVSRKGQASLRQHSSEAARFIRVKPSAGAQEPDTETLSMLSAVPERQRLAAGCTYQLTNYYATKRPLPS